MIPEIAKLVEQEPLPLARAMALAADHYYATKEPFGTAGDFVTAPEISQMFGELIGLWAADIWHRAGQPKDVIICELGPGRGTLMADARRAIAKAMPALNESAELWLVDRSPRLRKLQKEALPDAKFADSLADVPRGKPLILIANEFLDALPLTQFEKTEQGWMLRAVGPKGFERVMEASDLIIPESLHAAPDGAVYERNFASEALVAKVARRLDDDGGAALFIDYGYHGPALGDTLQSIKDGAFADVIETLGEADISAHVDFGAMTDAAKRAAPAIRMQGPEAQGMFLEHLGLSARAEALKAGADLTRRAEIEAAHVRLVSVAAMGRLFQALALSNQSWPEPAGFSTFEKI